MTSEKSFNNNRRLFFSGHSSTYRENVLNSNMNFPGFLKQSLKFIWRVVTNCSTYKRWKDFYSAQKNHALKFHEQNFMQKNYPNIFFDTQKYHLQTQMSIDIHAQIKFENF